MSSNQFLVTIPLCLVGEEDEEPPKALNYPLKPSTSLSCMTFRSFIKF